MEWFVDWWNDIDWAAGYWAAVGGLSAAITGVVAIWALVHAARDSRERSRPVMVAEYRVPENPHKVLDFVVRNAGASVARDIEVTFDPPLEPIGPKQATRPFLVKRYSEKISNLGPGQELTNVVHADLEAPDESDLPLDVTVTITYKRGRLRRYKDEYRLVVEVYAQHTFRTSTDSVLGRLTQIKDQLRKLSGDDGRGASMKYMADIRNELHAIATRLPEPNVEGGRE